MKLSDNTINIQINIHINRNRYIGHKMTKDGTFAMCEILPKRRNDVIKYYAHEAPDG